MSGLRSVPSALPGGGVGGREAGAALCPRCFLQRTAHCTLAHRSHPASGLTPLSCLSFHTLALPSEVGGRDSLVRSYGDQEKAFPAGVSP